MIDFFLSAKILKDSWRKGLYLRGGGELSGDDMAASAQVGPAPRASNGRYLPYIHIYIYVYIYI